MYNLRKGTKAQSMSEYVILIGIVAAAFSIMLTFAVRGVNGKLKSLELLIDTSAASSNP